MLAERAREGKAILDAIYASKKLDKKQTDALAAWMDGTITHTLTHTHTHPYTHTYKHTHTSTCPTYMHYRFDSRISKLNSASPFECFLTS